MQTMIVKTFNLFFCFWENLFLGLSIGAKKITSANRNKINNLEKLNNSDGKKGNIIITTTKNKYEIKEQIFLVEACVPPDVNLNDETVKQKTIDGIVFFISIPINIIDKKYNR